MFFFLRLVARNTLRHPLRSVLTLVGIVVAITAFGLLRTVVDAWYAGANATSASRLITRNAISLVFDLPIAYLAKIRRMEGVSAVSYANWFGGVYISEKNFFPQFAIDPRSYLALYPEYVVSDAERLDFERDRQGALVGRKLAATYGWKVGDVIPLRGTIYPGTWSFVIRGIYRGADRSSDETQFFFQFDYLNERMRQISADRADAVGIYVVGLRDAKRAADVSRAIDAEFRNSLAETLTETERAFQLGFVAMTEAILGVIQVVSILVIVIIMAVMANTMAMTARERMREYATLKAMGFGAGFLAALIGAESLCIALLGGTLGVLVTYPAAQYLGVQFGNLFPVFAVADRTVLYAFGAALAVGVVAALLPAWRAATVRVTDGLRAVG